MRRPSNAILAIAAGVVLLLSIVAFKRYLPYTGRGLLPRQPPPIVLAMEDAHLVGLGRDGKLWSLHAKKIEMSRNRSSTTISGITEGKVYDAGKVALRVEAGSASYDVYQKNLLLSGGVRIEGADGQKITGRGATWNSRTSTLRSLGPVSIETKWSKMTTDKMLVDVRNKEMSMWNVRMLANLREIESGAGTDAQ